MPHAIQFVAIMGPNDEHVAPKELAVKLMDAFPSCRIDWKAGDEFTLENVARLESIGIPEVMLEGARSFLGHRFVLALDPFGDANVELTGVVSTVHRDLGDALGFRMDPYDPSKMLAAAKILADQIDFRFHLEYEESFKVRIEPTSIADPQQIAQLHLPIPEGDSPTIQLHPLDDWQPVFRSGLVRWLQQSDHKKKISDTVPSFPGFAEYARAVANDIEEIGSVSQAWIVDLPAWSHQNSLLLDQGDCYSYIALSGVPKGILETAK